MARNTSNKHVVMEELSDEDIILNIEKKSASSKASIIESDE